MAILLVVLAGCGFGTPAAASSTSTQQQDQQKARAALTAMNTCLTRAGYRMVGPPPSEVPANAHFASNGGADEQMRSDPGYKQAYDKCATSTGFKQLTTRGPARKPSAQQIQKNNQQILKVYACMRQKGWTLADPTKDAQGSLSPPMPPSDVQGDQARMSQFGNDVNSCFKASGLGGGVKVAGPGSSGGSISVGG